MIELPEILKPLREKLLNSSLEDIYSLIVPPGSSIQPSYDENIIKIEPADE